MKNFPELIAVLLSLSCVLAQVSCASGGAEAAKPVILVVSFGTSYGETRAKTIDAIENAIAAAYPEYEVRRAFTSQTIIDRLKNRDKIRIDNVAEAMKRLRKDRVRDIVVQPTHIMNGLEYDEMIAAIRPLEKNFNSVRIGQPLLISDQDYDEVAAALAEQAGETLAGDGAVVFMGHGTEHEANAVYARLDAMLKNVDPRCFIATVEAEPTLDDVIAGLEPLGVKNVSLFPFMIVAGDHANNDMAGDDDDSWKSILTARGYEVAPVLRGLGEYPAIREIFVRHAGKAIAQ